MPTTSPVDTRALAQQCARDIADAVPDLTAADLASLLRHITDARLKEVVQIVGVAALGAQLDPNFSKLMRATSTSSPRATASTQVKVKEESSEVKVKEESSGTGVPAPKAKKKAASKKKVPVVVISDSDSPPATPSRSTPASPSPSTTPFTFPPVPVQPSRTTPVQATSSSAAAGDNSATPSSPARYHYHTPQQSGYTDDWLEAAAMRARNPGSSVFRTGSSHDRKTYLILIGAPGVGVYEHYKAVQRALAGYPKAIWCSFLTLEEANAAWSHARALGWTGDSKPLKLPAPRSHVPLPAARNHPPSPLVNGTDWYVVSAGVNPGVYSSYLEAKLNCWNVVDAAMKKYGTRVLAEAAYQRALDKGWADVVLRN
ncbi:hypothetical protein R3P38DRAFT_2774171 [Favolaschia claudopus]|uniref:Ribonuclease H1 N-terminal domain-containing protein n=1 Tax=Favolaschia claudopus TaxID=2862362 RepID=A0AAW0BZ12_9AGAR